jgi:hypothetical protein
VLSRYDKQLSIKAGQQDRHASSGIESGFS